MRYFILFKKKKNIITVTSFTKSLKYVKINRFSSWKWTWENLSNKNFEEIN